MIDLDAWEERAAILEFDWGMTRFAAETEAARRQGFKRWELIHALRERDLERARDHGAEVVRNHANDLSAVQRGPAEQEGPLSERDVSAGRDRLALLALRA